MQFSARYSFRNVQTGAIDFVYDLRFLPGEVQEIGTFTNRGYFQPIEDYLDKIGIREIFREIQLRNSRIGNISNALKLYAPKAGARFTSPHVHVSPPGTDSSQKIATTRFVRDYISQYPFPPKNVKNLSAEALDYSASIKWNDSADFRYDGMELSDWKGTKLVYRTDRYPTNENDGTVAVDNQSRDLYAQDGYLVDKLEPGETYYFKAFPYNSKDIYNRRNENGIRAKPHGIIELPPLNNGRGWLTAATDGNGNILFAGGMAGGYGSTTVVKYDLEGNKVVLEGLSLFLHSLAGATDGKGKVLFGGGYRVGLVDSEPTDKVEAYSPDGTKSECSPLSVARSGLAAASDGGGKVLFAGGSTAGGSTIIGTYSSVDTVDRYDTNGTRVTLAPLSTRKSYISSSTDGNGNALFGGGMNKYPTLISVSSSVEKYDPSGNRSTLPPLALARAYPAAATDGNGNVLFAGGMATNPQYEAVAVDVVDRYSPGGLRTTLAPLSVARTVATAVRDKAGNVYVAGGNTLSGLSAVVDKYTPGGVRTTARSLAEPRGGVASAMDGNGDIIFAGGSNKRYATEDTNDIVFSIVEKHV